MKFIELITLVDEKPVRIFQLYDDILILKMGRF